MNLALILDLIADTFGDRTAITDGDGSLTYAELRVLARAAAAELTAAESSTLAFADVSSRAVPVAMFGAAWAGASYAPLNFRLPASSLHAQLARLDAPLAVAGGVLAGQLGESVHITPQWLSSLDGITPPEDGYAPAPETPAIVLFTSGSSGAPKAAVLTHENLLSYILETVEFGSAEEDEALVLAAPPFHIAGVAAVLSSMYSGRRLLALPAFSAEAWLDLAGRERATHAFLVPTMLARIVHAMENDPTLGVPTLRSISYGGARMAAPILERALELFPDVNFVNAYGLTETSSTIAVLGPEDHRLAFTSDEPRHRRRLESVGQPLPGIEVQIIGDDGAPVPIGSSGLVRLRGAQVGGTYLDTETSLEDGGWLVTGDVGSLDDEGYLFIEGRADDVIIKGGENLSPSEIEDALLRHPAVMSVAVVGVADEEWGECVGAAVVVSGTEDAVEDVLREWVRGHLGSLKAPTHIEIVEELPMTASGKVLRREVRARFSELHGS